MSKAFPQGLDPGEEFRDDDILGLYKPSDTASAADGSLNKSKTILELKTMIEDEVINTNTDNIATNSSAIGVLVGAVTDNENDIDSLESRATALEDLQPTEMTDAVTFASVNTGYGDNPVVPEDVYNDTVAISSGYTLPSLSIKQTGHIVISKTTFNESEISLPSGTYSVISRYLDSSDSSIEYNSFASTSGVLYSMLIGDDVLITYRRIS